MKTMMFAAALLTLLPGVPAAQQAEPVRVIVPAAKDSEWHSYRRAYKTARAFERYTATRPLIQVHMQIRPLKPDLPMDGLHVQLLGEKTLVDIPLDEIGRGTIPLLKQAYDEDAVLRLNRQKGHYTFAGRYSVRERADGIYAGADLRAACEQLLSAQRESGYRLRLLGKRCAGIKLVYRLDGPAPQVLHRDGAGAQQSLPVTQGYPFENNTMGQYQLAVYRFAHWPAAGTVIAPTRPLAIGTIYE